MRKYINYLSLSFVLFLILFPITCSLDNTIDFTEVQGFYKYRVINPDSGGIIDTLYTTFTVDERDLGKDTLRCHSDFFGIGGISKKYIMGIWEVKARGNSYFPVFYTLFKTNMKTGDNWDVGTELGISAGSFTRKFKCISSDTTIFVNKDIKVAHINLVEQRDWGDVGGLWYVNQYGLDMDFRIVYRNSYAEKASDHSIYEHAARFTLVLLDFKNGQVMAEEQEKWKAQNSEKANVWMRYPYIVSDELIEPPPPPPKN